VRREQNIVRQGCVARRIVSVLNNKRKEKCYFFVRIRGRIRKLRSRSFTTSDQSTGGRGEVNYLSEGKADHRKGRASKLDDSSPGLGIHINSRDASRDIDCERSYPETGFAIPSRKQGGKGLMWRRGDDEKNWKKKHSKKQRLKAGHSPIQTWI